MNAAPYLTVAASIVAVVAMCMLGSWAINRAIDKRQWRHDGSTGHYVIIAWAMLLLSWVAVAVAVVAANPPLYQAILIVGLSRIIIDGISITILASGDARRDARERAEEK